MTVMTLEGVREHFRKYLDRKGRSDDAGLTRLIEHGRLYYGFRPLDQHPALCAYYRQNPPDLRDVFRDCQAYMLGGKAAPDVAYCEGLVFDQADWLWHCWLVVGDVVYDPSYQRWQEEDEVEDEQGDDLLPPETFDYFGVTIGTDELRKWQRGAELPGPILALNDRYD